ncbi:alcohol dehydrogenase catalytic domain-containing protein [Sphingosinicella humi]|uniref:alcohol dehydrogenase catalytic domain-containing protein n=1 Tax=Allosphingosinicella humi TaxID=2068657 RepID=UPI003C73EB12
MQLDAPGQPLRPVERSRPTPGKGELLIQVSACAVCRTDLHVVDGDLDGPLPIIPAHEVVGHILEVGDGASGFSQFTGFTRDGGFATHLVADAAYCFSLPQSFSDVEAAPLLCAGLIGYRAYQMAGDASCLGFYGFGAAAHVLAQVALWEGRRVFAFTQSGDTAGQAFARELGCEWSGASDEDPPEVLDAAIIFAPVGALVPRR